MKNRVGYVQCECDGVWHKMEQKRNDRHIQALK